MRISHGKVLPKIQADHNSLDRFDAIRLAREWVASLQMPANLSMQRTIEVCSPRYPIDDILSLVNPDIRKPFNMKEVVLRLVDDSRLAVFKELYGPSLMTAWAYIHGRSDNVKLSTESC